MSYLPVAGPETMEEGGNMIYKTIFYRPGSGYGLCPPPFIRSCLVLVLGQGEQTWGVGGGADFPEQVTGSVTQSSRVFIHMLYILTQYDQIY